MSDARSRQSTHIYTVTLSTARIQPQSFSSSLPCTRDDRGPARTSSTSISTSCSVFTLPGIVASAASGQRSRCASSSTYIWIRARPSGAGAISRTSQLACGWSQCRADSSSIACLVSIASPWQLARPTDIKVSQTRKATCGLSSSRRSEPDLGRSRTGLVLSVQLWGRPCLC